MRRTKQQQIAKQVIIFIIGKITSDNHKLSLVKISGFPGVKHNIWGFCFGVYPFFVVVVRLKLIQGINKQNG